MRKLYLVGLTAFLALTLAGCSLWPGQSAKPSSIPDPQTQVEEQTTPAATDKTPTPTSASINTQISPDSPVSNQIIPSQPSVLSINISGFSFKPATLEIKAGDSVTWTNQDSAIHDVAPFGGSIEPIQSPTFAKGGTYTYTFNNPGTFQYYCSLHPSMRGTIIVK